MSDRTRKALEDEMSELQIEIQRLFEIVMGRNLGHLLISHGSYVWRPAIDVYETEDDLVVKVDLAGISIEQTEVVVLDGTLKISGKRDNEPAVKKTAYHQMGISYGEFQSSVKIPVAVNVDKITAVYEDGLLSIHLPKQAAVEQPTKIKIVVGGDEEIGK